MARLSTSIVIYNPNLDDLDALFLSYSNALNFTSKRYSVTDIVYIIDNNLKMYVETSFEANST